MRNIVHSLASRSSSGDIFLDLAEFHLQKHEWGMALKAIERGVRKGKLSDPSRATRLMCDIDTRLGIRRRPGQEGGSFDGQTANGSASVGGMESGDEQGIAHSQQSACDQ